ncbi:hypothetical protein PVA38_11325 [Streptococcus pneumoniae D39]|nr:hypothetical protein PVA38_11325 [Streptococcus pneumoniae D39]
MFSAVSYCQSPSGILGISHCGFCLLYTSDAADEARSVDLGGRRIIKKKNKITHTALNIIYIT